MSRNKGPRHLLPAFTLLELFIVLALTLSILTMTNISVVKYNERLEANRFLSRFEREVKLTQLSAMTQGSRTFMNVYKDRIQFGRNPLITLLIPKGIRLTKGIQVKIEFSSYTGFSSTSSDIAFEWKEGSELRQKRYEFKLVGGNYVEK